MSSLAKTIAGLTVAVLSAGAWSMNTAANAASLGATPALVATDSATVVLARAGRGGGFAGRGGGGGFRGGYAFRGSPGRFYGGRPYGFYGGALLAAPLLAAPFYYGYSDGCDVVTERVRSCSIDEDGDRHCGWRYIRRNICD